LDTVTTPEQVAAMEHEIEFSTAEAERLEAEEYASLARTETQEAALVAAGERVKLLAAEVGAVRADAVKRQRQIAGEQAKLDEARLAVRAKIDSEWLARFDHTAASRGTAIVRAQNQQCTGCRMGIRLQMWNQLRDGELMNCDSCNRMLYWQPEAAPVEVAPAPDPLKASSGRAPRRSKQTAGSSKPSAA